MPARSGTTPDANLAPYRRLWSFPVSVTDVVAGLTILVNVKTGRFVTDPERVAVIVAPGETHIPAAAEGAEFDNTYEDVPDP